jgi:hypothetical protein
MEMTHPEDTSFPHSQKVERKREQGVIKGSIQKRHHSQLKK